MPCRAEEPAAAWKRYANPVLGISVEIPDDWQIQIGPGQARVDLLDRGYERTRAGLTVSSLPIPYSDDLVSRWKTALRQDDAKVAFESERNFTVDGAKARQIRFLAHPAGGVMRHEMVFVDGGGKVFTLECSAREELFQVFEPFCARSIESFHTVQRKIGPSGSVTSSDGYFSVQVGPGWEDVTELHQSQFPETVLALQNQRGMVNIRRMERGEQKPEELKAMLASEAQGAVDKGAKFLTSQISVLPNGLELYYVSLLQPSGQETMLDGIVQSGSRSYHVTSVAKGGDPLGPLELSGGVLKTFKTTVPVAPAPAPKETEAKNPYAKAFEQQSEPEKPRFHRGPRRTSRIVIALILLCMLIACVLAAIALLSLTRRTLEQNKP